MVGGTIRVDDDEPPVLTVAYAARRRLPAEAEATLARQAAQTLGVDPARASTQAVRLGPRALPDSAASGALAALLADYPRLRLTLSGDTAAVRAARARLVLRGTPAGRLRLAPDTLAPRARLTLLPDSARSPGRFTEAG